MFPIVENDNPPVTQNQCTVSLVSARYHQLKGSSLLPEAVISDRG